MITKMTTLQSINKYFNYIFYPFFIITGLFILKLMLTQSTAFTTYSSNESDYRNVLDLYNFCFAVLLLLKYFLTKIEEHQANFITILKQSIPFIIINIFFFILFFINNTLEDNMLTQINSIEQNSVPIYVFFYATSLYFVYSNYQSAYAEFQEIEQDEPVSTILLNMLQATEASGIHFLILCIGLYITRKTNLVTYLINNINIAFMLIGITSALVFLALFIIHKRKKQL